MSEPAGGQGRGRGRPLGTKKLLSEHPYRQAVACLSALEAIADLRGRPISRRKASANAVLIAAHYNVAVKRHDQAEALVTGARMNLARAPYGQRTRGKLKFKFTDLTGPELAEAAADRIRKIWEKVQPPPDPDGIWLDAARAAWIIVIDHKLAQNYFGRHLPTMFEECIKRTNAKDYWDRQGEWTFKLDASLLPFDTE